MSDRDDRAQSSGTSELPGVIETIGVAFTRLIARPWIVLGPILLDLWLWLGLKITAGPLMLKVADEVRPIDTAGDSVAGFIERQAGYNLTELTSMNLFMVRMPTFLPLVGSERSLPFSGWSPEFTQGPWWLLAAMVPALLAAGFVIGAAYLLMLGDVSRGRPPRFDARRTLTASYRIVFWVLTGIGLLVLLTWPLLVAQGVFLYTGSGIIGILLFLISIPTGVGFILFFFSVYAIVLDESSATQSFRSSYRVVRAYGWESLAFIVSYMIVTGGFPFVWRQLIDEAPGTLIAIFGNAFVSTGMIAAGMIYYEDRAAIVGPGDTVTQAG